MDVAVGGEVISPLKELTRGSGGGGVSFMDPEVGKAGEVLGVEKYWGLSQNRESVLKDYSSSSFPPHIKRPSRDLNRTSAQGLRQRDLGEKALLD